MLYGSLYSIRIKNNIKITLFTGFIETNKPLGKAFKNKTDNLRKNNNVAGLKQNCSDIDFQIRLM